MLSISTGAVSHEQQVYDMYPTFWTNDPGTDAIFSILSYDQVGGMHSPQVSPQGIRIPSRQSKTTNSHIQLRITSPSPLGVIQEEVISPKAAVVVAPLPNLKRRTRRPNARPMVKGNNMYGRKGTRRCMHCRQWKQKCEYDNISLPCTTCSQMGLECGVEHKLLPSESRALRMSAAKQSQIPNALDSESGDDIDIVLESIPRAPLPPTDHTLPSSDGSYIEFFWCTSATWFDLLNDRITDVEHPLAVCAAHRFGAHISSKLVRSAVLHYSSFRKERKLSYLGMQYLSEFYENAREAIDRESYAELLYACYIMCLNEMACRRKFAGDLEKHANGFILSYQKLVRMSMLTVEESKVMGQAYELIVQMTHVGSSRWHQDDHWFDLAKTITQRLGSAASRTLNSAKAISGWKDHSVWIPKSHPLSGAENVAYRLCTLFNRLSEILRSESNDCSFDWDDTAATVGESLNDFATIIFSQPEIPIPECYQSHGVFVLNDGVTTFSGDKYTRQLLTLYYILLLQYRIMVLEWSDSMWFDTLQTSLAICRLYPSPHQAQYPAPEVRFITNRGFWVALILVADFHNFRGRILFIF